MIEDERPSDTQFDDDAPVENSADERAYEKKLNALEIEKRDAELFWRQALAHPIGRREIWKIIDSAHPFETKFACGPNGFPNSEATWFHAGQQEFGLRLYHSLLLLNRDGALLMQDEHDSRFAKPKLPKAKRGSK